MRVKQLVNIQTTTRRKVCGPPHHVLALVFPDANDVDSFSILRYSVVLSVHDPGLHEVALAVALPAGYCLRILVVARGYMQAVLTFNRGLCRLCKHTTQVVGVRCTYCHTQHGTQCANNHPARRRIPSMRACNLHTVCHVHGAYTHVLQPAV